MARRALLAYTLLLFAIVDSSLAAPTQVYWSDSDSSTIWRANADGSGASIILTLPAGSEPRGVALDELRGRLYWTENGTNKIRRANLDGSSPEDVITTGLGFPADLEINPFAFVMYWADRDLDVIRRAQLDGSNVQTIISLPAPGNNDAPYFLALDRINAKIYWSDFDSGVIHRANNDGTGQEVYLSGLDRVRDLAISGYQIYWNDRDTRLVERQYLDGTGREVLYGPTGLTLPHGLAIDQAGGRLYIADADGRDVLYGPLGGGSPLVTIASAQNNLLNPWDIAVTVPEPSSWMLLAGASAALVMIRRRRRG